MRIESSVTAISWIPSDAIEGMPKLPFELGVARYDEPPPEHLEEGDLERLRDEDRFREANRLAAWIDVENGRVVSHGYDGTGLVGSTTLSLGVEDITIPGVVFDVLRHEPEFQKDAVRFVRTVGARAGFPAPRRVIGSRSSGSIPRPPGRRSHSRSNRRLLGTPAHRSKQFPRHWIYDRDGNLVAKSGTIDFKAWYRGARRANHGATRSPRVRHGRRGALEREISRELMAGKMITERRTLEPGETLVEQGAPATSSTSSSTACSPWRSTAKRLPRSGLARSSASRRCSRAARTATLGRRHAAASR